MPYRDGVLDENERWEQGIDHDPRSEEMFNILQVADTDDHFCWKSGGDGDNGEQLMYQLDVLFERQDRISKPVLNDGSG